MEGESTPNPPNTARQRCLGFEREAGFSNGCKMRIFVFVDIHEHGGADTSRSAVDGFPGEGAG